MPRDLEFVARLHYWPAEIMVRYGCPPLEPPSLCFRWSPKSFQLFLFLLPTWLKIAAVVPRTGCSCRFSVSLPLVIVVFLSVSGSDPTRCVFFRLFFLFVVVAILFLRATMNIFRVCIGHSWYGLSSFGFPFNAPGLAQAEVRCMWNNRIRPLRTQWEI